MIHYDMTQLPYQEKSQDDYAADLARLQRQLKESNKNVLILLEGWESSGKGALLNDIVRELDPRYYKVKQMRKNSKQASGEPFLKSFFTAVPRYGEMALFNHGPYSELLNDLDLDPKEAKQQKMDCALFEDLLIADGTLLIKLFLHQNEKTMTKRIEKLEVSSSCRSLVGPEDYHQLKHYDRYHEHFKQILEETDSPKAPWHVVPTEDLKEAGQVVLGLLSQSLENHLAKDLEETPLLTPLNVTPLKEIDLSLSVKKSDYKGRIDELQDQAGKLLCRLYEKKIPAIIVFEGTDAAGKGGSIRRLTRLMDPRGVSIATTAAPSGNEPFYHYLWRFYENFPEAGHLTIFDRSWYGRVLVERVEGFTPDYRWQAAYEEINRMEKSLTQGEAIFLKFLLVIDKNEQKKRFEERAADPDKQHKLTDEDWRNHEAFGDYEAAMNEMVARTSTDWAPWLVIPSQDKRYARLKVLEHFVAACQKVLKS